ncbi:transporter gate domain-containing protein [Salmonella enterica subsp. enterica serovar Daytona]|uniref:Transporter gate domain-containing protein n=1 Tax=Salmonella enterica subsp. enterica serovar Daytona TaxID=1962639 RepID=A0A447JP98_SALET|nr:transporter gate domain-containing protein [Salmonella enterica subsp. enterica serovar Daytona]
MAQQVDGAAMPLDTEKVGIKGYLAFFLTIIFFSGVFSGSEGWWRVFDFTVLNGSFGHVTGTQTFRGAGGTGAKDGFLFALELAPSVILSLGIIAITDGLGGLRAAQQLMTPILKPLLGIPGICSLALIANLQNTDAAAGMTKELAQEGEITERDKVIFCRLADQRQRYYHQLFLLRRCGIRLSGDVSHHSAGGHSAIQIYRRKPFARLD